LENIFVVVVFEKYCATTTIILVNIVGLH